MGKLSDRDEATGIYARVKEITAPKLPAITENKFDAYALALKNLASDNQRLKIFSFILSCIIVYFIFKKGI